MRPFIRWAGSKYRFKKEIISEFPETFRNYHEPFLGSGSIFFSLKALKRQWRHSYLSDINGNLIQTYWAVRDENERVCRVLETYLLRNSEDFYYEMRKNISTPAGFLYLNRAGFSGLYRENKSGEFNVPWRKHDFITMGKKISLDKDQIVQCGKYLRYFDPTIRKLRWDDALTDVNGGDVVYLDPPYIPYGDGGFVNYSADGFTEMNHMNLKAMIDQYVKKEVKFFLSNSYTELSVKIYGQPKKILNCSDSINSGVEKGTRKEGLWVFG